MYDLSFFPALILSVAPSLLDLSKRPRPTRHSAAARSTRFRRNTELSPPSNSSLWSVILLQPYNLEGHVFATVSAVVCVVLVMNSAHAP